MEYTERDLILADIRTISEINAGFPPKSWKWKNLVVTTPQGQAHVSAIQFEQLRPGMLVMVYKQILKLHFLPS